MVVYGTHFLSSHRQCASFRIGSSIFLRNRDCNLANSRRLSQRLRASGVVDENNVTSDHLYDVAIVGAGLGGLCAGAILSTVYGKSVGVFEAHYHAGGCLHAYQRRSKSTSHTFTFDSGPTILLGCSSNDVDGGKGSSNVNALEQVLRAVNETVKWIPYDGWGMIEEPKSKKELRWKLEVGPNELFEKGPLTQFAIGSDSDGPGRNTSVDAIIQEFRGLQLATNGLTVGAEIPAMAMRPGPSALLPLLRYPKTLWSIIQQSSTLQGTFDAYMNGPEYEVKSPWLRAWLDALAFSLSGLPAARTSAAAMAFVLRDMHTDGARLDYPQGGMGKIVEALVRAITKNNSANGEKSDVHLRQRVSSIDFDDAGVRAVGLTLANGKRVHAKDGVIFNAPVWSLRYLVKQTNALKLLNDGGIVSGTSSESHDDYTASTSPPSSWVDDNQAGWSIVTERHLPPDSPDGDENAPSFLDKCDTAEMTGSFLHLHLALDATGLDMSKLEAHYTVMDRSLLGSKEFRGGDGPCGEQNMIAVSNPCKIDDTLAPPGYIVVHAYGAGNEPYEVWEKFKNDRQNPNYEALKEERASVLWRAVESIIPDARERAVIQEIGSPLTHERFLRRPRGTYGSATEDYLPDGSTPISNFFLAGDGVFPGIGLPAVAISGASAANGLVGVLKQWKSLTQLKL